MVGWIFNIPAFQSIVPGFEAMRFNTALCFVLFASALLLTQYQSSRYIRATYFILSLLGTIIGLITVTQDLFDFTSGLDQLFVTDKTIPSYGIPFPGRMAFNASINFVFLGLGFLLLIFRKRLFNVLSQCFFSPCDCPFSYRIDRLLVWGIILSCPFVQNINGNAHCHSFFYFIACRIAFKSLHRYGQAFYRQAGWQPDGKEAFYLNDPDGDHIWLIQD